MQIVNNFEISVRKVELDSVPAHFGTKLLTLGDCAALSKALIANKAQEHFVVFLLNLNKEVLGYQTVAMGRQDMCPVDMRVLFRAAVSLGASFIVVTHNHPEGNPTPSKQDLRVTDMVCLGGDLLGIPLLDHIIVASGGMFSMSQAGMLLPKLL